MPGRREFYDPVIQVEPVRTEEQQVVEEGVQEQVYTGLTGIVVTKPGIYLHAEDVAATLRAMSDDYIENLEPQYASVLKRAAEYFDGATSEEAVPETVPEVPVAVPSVVNRVEVYPDNPDEPRPRWHARPVDSDGAILSVTDGSFDQSFVIEDAKARWPGVDVYLIPHAGVDTVWDQGAPDAIRSSSSGQRAPSPRRLWPG